MDVGITIMNDTNGKIRTPNMKSIITSVWCRRLTKKPVTTQTNKDSRFRNFIVLGKRIIIAS